MRCLRRAFPITASSATTLSTTVPGSGTTVTIYLPRVVDTVEPVEARGAAAPGGCGGETVLVVEDEPSVLKLAKTALERSGYVVLTADTPGEAIRLATDHVGRIHLVVTDVIMPEMNGRTLAARLQSLHPHVKRLFMSGYAADVIADDGVVDPTVSFIQKPFSIKELTAKVRETLDRL
jgi:two-component system cell cycle sensor histidine kinase/response regulator CckA